MIYAAKRDYQTFCLITKSLFCRLAPTEIFAAKIQLEFDFNRQRRDLITLKLIPFQQHSIKRR